MSSDEPALHTRLLELFPKDQLQTHDVHVQHLALATHLFEKRSLFDDFAAALRTGAVRVHLYELLWFAVSQDLLALGFVVPAQYSLAPPHKKAPVTPPDRKPARHISRPIDYLLMLI